MAGPFSMLGAPPASMAMVRSITNGSAGSWNSGGRRRRNSGGRRRRSSGWPTQAPHESVHDRLSSPASSKSMLGVHYQARILKNLNWHTHTLVIPWISRAFCSTRSWSPPANPCSLPLNPWGPWRTRAALRLSCTLVVIELSRQGLKFQWIGLDYFQVKGSVPHREKHANGDTHGNVINNNNEVRELEGRK